jgi:hypothetical protein
VENMEISDILILALIGGAFLYEVWAAIQSIRAKNWKTVKGKVIESDLDVGHSGSATVQIKYSYQVKGKDYESSNSVFGAVGYVFWLFKKWYINEDALVVYYNPSKPQKAVLVTGLRLFFIAEFIPFFIVYYWFLKPVYGM